MSLFCFGAAPPPQPPNHLAVIPDGNRRYSRRRYGNTTRGYEDGVSSLQSLMKWCQRRGVRELSVYCWSSENWSRPPDEVEFCMAQLSRLLDEWVERPTVAVRYCFVSSSPEKIPVALYKKMQRVEEATKAESALVVYLYVSYGFREDAAAAAGPGGYGEHCAVPQTASAPDLLIRTSGECRISNFCMWHLAYTELMFIDTPFPRCTDRTWDWCVRQFSKRARRFGR